MEYRKLIKFGDSSFVVSLPKGWVNKNSLKKGDSIFFEENSNNELIICPKNNENNNGVERELTIDITGKSEERIQREIIAAYLNDYTLVKIIGKEFKNKEKYIRDLTHNLIAFEIMERTSNCIVIKDFLEFKNVDINDLVRKMDLITRAMMSDLKLFLKEDNSDSIIHRDEEVNRIMFLGIKVIRHALKNPQYPSHLKLSTLDLLKYWDLFYHIEKIADCIKRATRNFKKINNKHVLEELIANLSNIENAYLAVMKAYYNEDINLAFDTASFKKGIARDCDKVSEEFPITEVYKIIETFKDMIAQIHTIGRRIYS